MAFENKGWILTKCQLLSTKNIYKMCEQKTGENQRLANFENSSFMSKNFSTKIKKYTQHPF